MSNPLVNYLHDHLGGSTFAIELLESLRDQYSGQPLGGVASDILAEVQDDQQVLLRIIERVGKETFDLKVAAGWVAEKVSRLKFQSGTDGSLGTFEALETLTLGIQGKASLWRALNAIREVDERVAGEDFNRLVERAEAQHAKVEAQRLLMARGTFEPAGL